jgi:hypothetical protein
MKTRFPLAVLSLAALCSTQAQTTNPPLVLCQQPVAVEATSTNRTRATVMAGIQDIDGDALTGVWFVNGRPRQTNDFPAGFTTNMTRVSLTSGFAFGTNEVTFTVTDGVNPPVSCTTTVTVQDTTPPQIVRLTATPNLLWPPNHQMVLVRLQAQIGTNEISRTRTRIIGIRSNERRDGQGDGSTLRDKVIVGNMSAFLRAERSGKGEGRIYTIAVEAADTSGNKSTNTTQVVVPHDRRKR